MESAPMLLAEGFIIIVFLLLVAIDTAGAFRRSKPQALPPRRKGTAPSVLVIIPCKGQDFELYKNLISVKNQAFPNFEVVAVLDGEDDPARDSVLRAGIPYLISSSSCEGCSGKVRAISTAIESLPRHDVYVIADSDIRVGKGWLAAITAPLASRKTGLCTMYPYFKPVGGFWSNVKSVWGRVGEGMMAREATKFGWGGSLAFRKGLLDAKSFRFFKDSGFSVSDDICLTMIARRKGLKIAYVENPQPLVYSKDDALHFMEWANRQTALSILGNRDNLYTGLAFYSAESLVILSGILLSASVSPLFLILLLHSLRNGFIISSKSRPRNPLAIPIALIIPFIYLANLLTASGMKSITWRGSIYKLR